MNSASQEQREVVITQPGVGVESPVAGVVTRAQEYLLRIQKEDGHWCGELEGDTILESEYILTKHFIGRLNDRRTIKAGRHLVEKSLPDGGWAIYPGGPPEISASVKAYFALKLLGHDAHRPYMARARRTILDLGGLEATNSFTRIYLAIFGQVPWERCPAVPPELILLPKWCPVNLYEMSAWTRAIVVPLSVIWASKPSCPVPKMADISELWGMSKPSPQYPQGLWPAIFRLIDASFKSVERHQILPCRRRALKACKEWLLQHFQNSDGVGAIFPPIINSIIALRCLGYELDHPVVRSQMSELERLEIEEDDSLRLAPCFSPVWDTALTMVALAGSGFEPQDPALCRAAEWLLDREVKTTGDWAVKNRKGKPGGWYFEYRNEFFPDVDDTFEVLTALSSMRFPDPSSERRRSAAMQRALDWIFSMQNKDGGWASFDRGCDRDFLTKIPFADHNAMIDPSTSDITGRGLETFGLLGYPRQHSSVRRAIDFLLQEQEDDGTWYGRWGCNYIYGTWLALRGLECCGEDMQQGRVQKAVRWLRQVQNRAGGWGELPQSYKDPTLKGRGPSTAAQTAWALLGLMAAGDFQSDSVRRGIEYLLATQKEDGSWQDEHWTATGFPKVFYLRYHLYATYFPLMALGRFLQHESR